MAFHIEISYYYLPGGGSRATWMVGTLAYTEVTGSDVRSAECGSIHLQAQIRRIFRICGLE